MPVNVGQIAEQTVQSRFNPYDRPNPELAKIQANLEADKIRLQSINNAVQVAGQVATTVHAQAQQAKLANESLLLSGKDNSKAAKDTTKAVKVLREIGSDNVPADNAALKIELEDTIQKAIDVKIGVPRTDKAGLKEARKGVRSAKKELRQFKRGEYDIGALSGGVFETKEDAALFLEGYSNFKDKAPAEFKTFLEKVQGGKYDPYYNANEEVVKYALEQGRNGKLVPKKGGQTMVEFTAKVPVRDEYGRLTYGEDGNIILEDKTASYDISLFDGKGTWHNQIKPPPTAATLITEGKDSNPLAYKAYHNPNAPKILPGSPEHSELISAWTARIQTDPNFVKATQRTVSLISKKDVKLDINGDGKVTAEEIWTVSEPTINANKRTAEEIAFNKGEQLGHQQLGKESIVGKPPVRLTESERKAFEHLNQSKGKVINLLSGDPTDFIGESYNGKLIVGAEFTSEIETTRNRRAFWTDIPGTSITEAKEVAGGTVLKLAVNTGSKSGKPVTKNYTIDLSEGNKTKELLQRVFGDEADELLKYITDNKLSIGANNDPLGINN